MSINSLTTSKVSYSRCLHSKTAHVCRQNAWCMLWFILSWLLSVFYQLLSLSSRNDPKSWVGRLKQKLWNRVKKRWSKEISLKNQTVGMTWSNECATPNWKKKKFAQSFCMTSFWAHYSLPHDCVSAQQNRMSVKWDDYRILFSMMLYKGCYTDLCCWRETSCKCDNWWACPFFGD